MARARRRQTSHRSILAYLVLGWIVAFIVASFPYRLAALVVETQFIHPGYLHTTNRADKYWECQNLLAFVEVRLGYTVYFVPDLMQNEGAYGMTVHDHRTISIDASLGWNDRLSVLAHEAAHTLQPWDIGHENAESFAESVSALVAHDGIREHARYLAPHRSQAFLVDLAYWREIYRVANVLQEQ